IWPESKTTEASTSSSATQTSGRLHLGANGFGNVFGTLRPIRFLAQEETHEYDSLFEHDPAASISRELQHPGALHSMSERLTVRPGSFNVGMGEKLDSPQKAQTTKQQQSRSRRHQWQRFN